MGHAGSYLEYGPYHNAYDNENVILKIPMYSP